jgi:hypothetical protein
MQWPTPACRRNVSMRTFGKSGRPMASTAGAMSFAVGVEAMPWGRIGFLRKALLAEDISSRV